MEELLRIQSGLNVPKNQRNDFGGFNYRSAEDILEAVKPLLKDEGCILTISDELVNIGERYYVKATAVISKVGEEKAIGVSAYARESKEKKGMDASQITGSTSSYARKYALNGLFAIDDTRDADTMDNTKNIVKGSTVQKNTSAKQPTIKQVSYLKSLGYDGDFSKLTFEEASKQIKLLSEK
jgi:hypothetical protein